LQKKIILLAGPTASGKSNLAILLAKKIKGEIINTDSMQVYKEFLILSSRPSKNDLKKVSHHLYGFLSVKKNFSTGEWLKLVKKKIYQITKKKRIPILVGGTGLYFNAITKGISKIPVISDKYRETIRANHKLIGQKKFYEKLIELDPLSQKNISPNDTQRSIRAYEVKFFTGKSLYEWISKTKSDFIDYDIRKIYLDTPRDVLLKKIEHRTNKMFKENCAKEVKNFLSLNIKNHFSQ
jgi:tRNA dimethylallyltransferase